MNALLAQNSLVISVSDTVDPLEATLTLGLLQITQYPGVQTVRRLFVSGKVGQAMAVDLNDFFVSVYPASFTVNNSNAILQLQGTLLVGTPQAAGNFTVQVVVSEPYSTLAVGLLIKVTTPLPPYVLQGTMLVPTQQSSTQVSIAIPPSMFVNPENTSMQFQANQVVVVPNTTESIPPSFVLSPLPSFLSFDPVFMQLSGLPSTSDVGHWSIGITAISQSGPWQGNATIVVSFSVVLSWSDFVVLVYSWVRYAPILVAWLTTAWTFRAMIRNTLMWSRVKRTGAPEEFLRCEPYTLRRYDGSLIMAGSLHSVSVQPVKNGSRQGCTILPGYIKDVLRCRQRSQFLLGIPGPTGVSWVSCTERRDETVDIRIDFAALNQSAQDGRLCLENRFIVQVAAAGFFSSGFILDAFEFSGGDVLPPLAQCPSDEYEPLPLTQDEGHTFHEMHSLVAHKDEADLSEASGRENVDLHEILHRLEELEQQFTAYKPAPTEKIRRPFFSDNTCRSERIWGFDEDDDVLSDPLLRPV
jgi:hypothetical protein